MPSSGENGRRASVYLTVLHLLASISVSTSSQLGTQTASNVPTDTIAVLPKALSLGHCARAQDTRHIFLCDVKSQR
jgi:hypothetical protein